VNNNNIKHRKLFCIRIRNP